MISVKEETEETGPAEWSGNEAGEGAWLLTDGASPGSSRPLWGRPEGHAEGLTPELVSSWTSPRGCLFLISSGL